MGTRLTLPPLTNSFLARLDSRWKLVGIGGLVLSAALLRSLPAVALAVVGALFWVWLARVPRGWYLGRLEGLAWMLLIFVLPLPFLVRGPGPTWSWGPVTLSMDGVVLGLVFAGKAVAVISYVVVLLVSAPLDTILKAAHALYIPGLLVQLTLMSYRYLFLLADELARLRLAMRVRGFRNRATWHTYQTFGRVAGTLVVRGHERAERVAQSMRCRGFEGEFHSLAAFQTTGTDVLFCVLSVSSGAGLVALDRLVWS